MRLGKSDVSCHRGGTVTLLQYDRCDATCKKIHNHLITETELVVCIRNIPGSNFGSENSYREEESFEIY
jgi:hypothetical protein